MDGLLNECLKVLGGIGTIACTLLAMRKILTNVVSPINTRLDSLEQKLDENTKRDEAQISERRVHFRALKVILMKLQGEHMNGDMAEVKQMLDECLINNLH